jgi:transcription-repair coupling factor (superfamily II helicase)
MTSVFQIPSLPTSGSHQRWSGLSKASLALTAAQIAQANDGICVLITGTTAQAETLTREIQFFTSNGDVSANDLKILHFPDRETLPYDSFSPHQDILSERLATLYQLPNITKGILITPISNLMHRLPPIEYIAGNCLFIKTGQLLDSEQLAINLSKAGYHRVETVFEHGEFAVRGSLVDVFPMGCDTPFRIDFFDDEIENLRSFDAETQLTIEKLDSIELLPASEIPLTAPGIKQLMASHLLASNITYRYFLSRLIC